MVDGAQGEGYGNMNIDQGMMNFNPPNYHDSSSQTLFPCEAGIGNLMSEDNASNANCYQFAVVTNQLGSDYFPLAVPPTTPTFVHMSNAQETMGGENSQYPPGFFQTHSKDQWYPLKKQNNIQHPSSTPFGTEEIQFGLLNQGSSNGAFYPSGLSNTQFPQPRLNLQDELPSSSNLHLPRNWISEDNVLSNATTPPTSRSSAESRNAVYDPTYESMGLPIDPHLRMFLARRDPTGDEM
ncbi:hypothetical protein IC575_003954 [Cucumis melo]